MNYGMNFLKNLAMGQKITISITPDKAKSLRSMASQLVRVYGNRYVPSKSERFCERKYRFFYDYARGQLTIDVLPAKMKEVCSAQ